MKSLERPSIDEAFFNIIGPLAEEFKFEEVFTQKLNNWQLLAEATNDIVTPANLIDAAAFGAGIYGIHNLDSWKGIGWAGMGLLADFVDGKVARATGTQSELGEAIDASGDKVKLAYALYQLWHLDLAPKPLITAIAIQNGINAGLTVIDRASNKPPTLHANIIGKTAFFVQEFGLGFHVIGSEVTKKNEKFGKALKVAGTVLGSAGLVVGGVATSQYVSTMWNARKSR